MGASKRSVEVAQQKIAAVFGVDAGGISFDPLGSDRATVGGLSDAKVGEDSKFNLERALTNAFGGGRVIASFSGDNLQSLIFSHGDLDGTITTIAGTGERALTELQGKISSMKQTQRGGPG